MSRFLALLAGLLCLLGPAVSLAQPAPLIIDQSRADRSPPTASPQPEAPQGAGQVKAAPATIAPFVLKGVRVQGSGLSQDALSAAWAPYIGRPVDDKALGQIADAIGAVYARADIALYSILLPRQQVQDGVVRFTAVEGYVGAVEITATPGRPPSRLLSAYAARLKAEKPLRRSTLERYIALMRDIPGATVDVQVLQGAAPGAVKLAISSKRRRFDSSLSLNTRGSTYLGRTQLEASVSVNSAIREGDMTRVTFAAPTEVKRFQYVGLTHVQPIGSDGMTLSLNAGHLRTHPDYGAIDLTGTATTGGVQLSYPLIRSNRQNLYLTGGVDGVNSDNAIFGQTFSAERTRALRLAAAWSTLSPTRALTASVTASQGLNVLGARMSNPLMGDAGFTKINGLASLTQARGQWVVRLAASAQYAATDLPATEAFALGGAQFGRGFASAVATGQSGYAGSAEIGWRPKALPKVVAGSELYAFADHGRVYNRPAYAAGDAALTSVGGGVRVAIKAKSVVEVEVAKAVEGPSGVGRALRLALNLRTRF